MAIAQPLFINIPFSNSGLKTNTIPNNDDSGVGNASWEQGFPPETMKQIAQGGVPPRGQDMNGILNKVTLILQYIQSGTPFKYNSTFANSINGYPKGALVLSTDGVTIWRNTTAGNTTDPDNGGTNWVNFLAQFGNYLPLAGGTLTGTLTINPSTNVQSAQIYRITDGRSWQDISFRNADNVDIATIRYQQTETENSIAIFPRTFAGQGVGASFRIVYNETEGAFVQLPSTPAKTSNNTLAATTAFVKNVAADYLPLAGGTISGSIMSNMTSPSVRNTGTDGRVTIGGGTAYNTGAFLWLYGKDFSSLPGVFDIDANNGTTYARLHGAPDGTLTWSGPVPSASTDSTQLATTAYVKDCVPKSVGSATNPVYTDSSGTVTACTYSLNETVPANAVFTDTVTTVTVTGSGNAVTAISASDGALTVTKGNSYLPLTGGTLKTVSGNTVLNLDIGNDRTWQDLAFRDADGVRLGFIRFEKTSSKTSLTLVAGSIDGNANAGLGIIHDSNDNLIVELPSTPAVTSNSNQVASTAYVKACVPANKGGGTKLLFTNSSGVLTESTSTVGSKTKPVFLSSGTITESDATVGTEDNPVYMKAGVITACAKNLTDYLPLAGGTMTGVIKRTGDFVQNTGDSNWLRFCGATAYNNGAYLQLWGKDHTSNAGEFRLTAIGTATRNLIGKPDGTLTWNGPVPAASTDSTQLATTAYVKDCVPKSVGSGTKPVYANANGVITESGSTVGSADKPVWLSSGTITACSFSFPDLFPDYKTITVIANNVDTTINYTAPSNGYFIETDSGTAATLSIEGHVVAKGILSSGREWLTPVSNVFLPMKKGAKVTSSGTIRGCYAYFISI